MKFLYQNITNKIIAELDKGVIPWKKTWVSGYPKNLVNKKNYRGINTLILGLTDYDSPYWLSFKQVLNLGGRIKKEEIKKYQTVVFWKRRVFVKKVIEIDKETGKEEEVNKSETIPLLRYYRVWNLRQTTGIKDPDGVKKNNKIENAEKIVKNYKDKPRIVPALNCWYKTNTDEVGIPNINKFTSEEEYYAALFHELVHSTGNQKRLNRKGFDKPVLFGSNDYSKEELVAEIGSAFLSGIVGIESKTIENSAAYIDGWRKKLSEDIKLVVFAAAKAQKAADYIQGIKYQKEGVVK